MSNPVLLAQIEDAILHYEKAIGHVASRTRNMIANHGEIEALSRQLDKTFEAIVVRFDRQFGTDAVQAAEWRLANADKLLT